LASKQVYLSLGANVGNREKAIHDALAAIENETIRIHARSSLYETEPQEVTDQPWFLNMVVCCETTLFPTQLLNVLMRVERELGRVRGPSVVRRGPRTIDIDILLYNNAIVDTPQLTIPHPRMLDRRFVLEPLLEIAPDLKMPGTGKPLKSYLRAVAAQNIRKASARSLKAEG
jgi:2-amino-4-hydroxy-6-hydroxymethyldihydropteridine diphosphokinase